MGKVTIYTGRVKQTLPKIMDRLKEVYKDYRCILLVPEQYTLQGERDVLAHLAIPGFSSIQVLSPSRLYERIFEQAGKDPRTPITLIGKQVAVAQAILKSKNALTYYQSVVSSPGFGEKVLDEINQWKENGYTLDFFKAQLAEKELSPALDAKMKDILVIWQEYEAILAGQFIDGSDIALNAIIRASQSGFFKDTCLFVYGFDILSHDLRQLLTIAAANAFEIMVTMVADALYAPDGKMFKPAWNSIRLLAKGLTQQNLPYQIKKITASPSFSSPEIEHLSKNLFASPYQTYQGPCDHIKVHVAANIYQEVEKVANEVVRLHRQGLPWEEMALLTGDVTAYRTLLYGLFKQYNIPFYLDEPSFASQHGLIVFLIHGIRAATKGYQKEDVTACIKSGFAPITQEEGYFLENYALAYGIIRKQWTRPFTKGKEEERLRAEDIRQKLIAPLAHFEQQLLQAKNTHSSLSAIMALLEAIGAYDTLRSEEETLLSLGLDDIASQNRQVWELVLNLLDQMYELMKGRRIPALHIAAWLEAAFLSAQLHGLPPTASSLFCGQLGHALPGSITTLFVLGLNDGLLKRQTTRLLTDQEQLHFEPSLNDHRTLYSSDMVFLAQVDLWRSLSLPSEALYLSYPQADIKGQVLRPLLQFEQIKALFPQLVIEDNLATKEPSPPLCPAPALAALGPLLQNQGEQNPGAPRDVLSPLWQQAFYTLYQSPVYQPQIKQLLINLNGKKQVEPLNPTVAADLFGRETLSISRLETFAACPYRHFVEYGLRPIKRPLWEFTPQDIGTFYHGALKNYTQQITAHSTWPAIEEKESNHLMTEAMAPLVSAWLDSPLNDSPMAQAQGKRYIQTLQKAAWVFTKQAQQSAFVPFKAEVSFGYENSLLPPIILKLSCGEEVFIRGIVDRIDLFEDDQSIYLRVVDYKSSEQSLEPTAAWYGVQLQLLLYLQAAISSMPGSLPAGAFYFHIADPVVELDQDLVEVAEEKIASMLKLKGVSLADTTVYKAMDHKEQPSYIEKLFNKDGSLSKNAKALSLNEMEKLLQKSLSLANDFANQIYQGDIAISPIELPKKPACAYCEFQGVCGIDPANEALFTRRPPAMTMEELKERLGHLSSEPF